MKQVREDTGIVHLRVPDTVRLRDFLLAADLSPLPIEITSPLIDEWLHYGSIYADGRRLRADQQMIKDQIVRLHTRRKTYVTQIPDLNLAFDHEDFLILNKPSGLPTHATLDNCIENAQHLLSEKLGVPLYVTHRLDVATRGLLILAKNPRAQAGLNKQFAKRQVEKFYRAWVSQNVPLGMIVHWMDPHSRVPKVMSSSPVENWWECRLEILSNENGLLTIQLHTGKTHQIRAQLAVLGAPIDGDQAYGSRSPARYGHIDLECQRLKFRWMQETIDVSLE